MVVRNARHLFLIVLISVCVSFNSLHSFPKSVFSPGEGRTLGISGRGCAAGTLEPLTYTRASSAVSLV